MTCLWVYVLQRPAMMSIDKGYFYTDASCLVTEYCKHGSVLVNTYSTLKQIQALLKHCKNIIPYVVKSHDYH